MEPINKLLYDAIEYAKPYLSEGCVATYIPELSKVLPSRLGAALIWDGKLFQAGDAEIPFTIQSVAKVFSLILALETSGPDELFEHVGVSPSEEPFNCLPKVANGRCVPANPMLNAGCFISLDHIQSADIWTTFLARVRKLCNNERIDVNIEVYQSEKSCSERNREMLQILEENHALKHEPNQILDLHIRSSSLVVTAADLAFFAAVLSNGGKNPYTKETLIDPFVVRTVRTLMFLCGMYDATGRYAQAIGIPSKSGVGGGIIAAGQGIGIATFGPALDEFGNSVGGQRILEFISNKLRLHSFESKT